MADRKISDLTALTTPASGDYLPIVDISEAAAASKNKRITIEELMRGVPNGTAAAPGIAFETDPNTGIYSPGADQLAISTNGTGRLFVDASGNVGVKIASPSSQVLGAAASSTVAVTGASGGSVLVLQNDQGTVSTNARIELNGVSSGGNPRQISYIESLQTAATGAGALVFGTHSGAVVVAATERLRITSAGLVGIGTSAPQAKFEVAGDAVIGTDNAGLVEFTSLGVPFFAVAADASNYRSTRINIVSAGGWADLSFDAIGTAPKTGLPSAGSFSGSIMYLDASAQRVGIGTTSPGSALEINAAAATSPFIAKINTAEAARIDSSGKLLLGTSTSRTIASSGENTRLQIESPNSGIAGFSIITNRGDNLGPVIYLGKSRGSSNGGTTIVADGDILGEIRFAGTDGTDIESMGARIIASVDGTPGVNDMPGKIAFLTSADGSASPTERLRITSAGVLQIAEAGNITVGTTTGTKIGTATTQKIGFYNATPVVQPTAVADATDAASGIARLNDLLARLRTLGIIAT